MDMALKVTATEARVHSVLEQWWVIEAAVAEGCDHVEY